MPDRNGMGPDGNGPASGRGKGLCRRNVASGVEKSDSQQAGINSESSASAGCRGPMGCGTGRKSGGSGRGAAQGGRGAGGRRSQ